MSDSRSTIEPASFSPADRGLALAQLLRLPNVFTAWADILLGYWMIQWAGEPAFNRTLGLLVLASSCLYAAGMVWNDVFDRETDARERPGRPIPSGRISLAFARQLGTALLIVGVVAASVVSVGSGAVALALVALIFGYDAFGRSLTIGPLLMGGCRGLNVLLGMSPALAAGWTTGWPGAAASPGVIWIPLANMIYIVGVTWFSRQEAAQSSRGSLIHGALKVALGLAFHAILLAQLPGVTAAVWPIAGIFVATLAMRIGFAVIDPSPATVQQAVKFMVFGIVILDAIWVLALRGPHLAWAVILLLAPASFLGRWLYAT